MKDGDVVFRHKRRPTAGEVRRAAERGGEVLPLDLHHSLGALIGETERCCCALLGHDFDSDEV